jgi:hypothetical protein
MECKQTENVSQEQGSTVGQDSTTTVPTDHDSSRQDTTEGQGSDITVPTANEEQCTRTTPHPLSASLMICCLFLKRISREVIADWALRLKFWSWL